MKRKTLVLLILLVVLVLDQGLKIWVKTNMAYGEEIQLLGLNGALIHFVENNGMAFGLSLGADYGKLFLTLFRLAAVTLLSFYLARLVRERAERALLSGFTLVLAGAIGNIIDSVFYGFVFSESSFHGGVAKAFPEGGGYAPLLYGRVVDMLYFPLFYGEYPEWIPWLGGTPYLFFRPVFNVADVAITLGVVVLIGFYFRQVLREPKRRAKVETKAPAED